MPIIPSQKAIQTIQKTFAENQSIEIRLSKGELMDLLYGGVSGAPAIVLTARKVLEAKGLLFWSSRKDNYCILYLEKIKQERV